MLGNCMHTEKTTVTIFRAARLLHRCWRRHRPPEVGVAEARRRGGVVAVVVGRAAVRPPAAQRVDAGQRQQLPQAQTHPRRQLPQVAHWVITCRPTGRFARCPFTHAVGASDRQQHSGCATPPPPGRAQTRRQLAQVTHRVITCRPAANPNCTLPYPFRNWQIRGARCIRGHKRPSKGTPASTASCCGLMPCRAVSARRWLSGACAW